MARIENLIQNGRAKYSGSMIEVRRNYSPPVSSRWAGDGGTAMLSTITGASDGPGGLPTYTRKTWTVIGNSLLDIAFNIASAANAIPVTPNEVWTHSLYLRSSRTISHFMFSEMSITYYDSSGVQVGSIQYGTTDKSDMVAGEWHRYWITSTVPSGVASALVYLRKGIDKAQWSVGDYLDCGASLSEKSSILGDAFDGSYSPDPELTSYWTGTANSSPSVLSGLNANIGVAVGNALAIQSNRGFRIIPQLEGSNSIDSNLRIVGGGNGSLSFNGVTIVPGQWVALRGILHLDDAQINNNSTSLARCLRIAHNNVSGWSGSTQVTSGSSPNLPGTYEHILVTQIPPDAVWMGGYAQNGAPKGGGDVYWTDLRAAQADSREEALAAVQTYFDGDSEPFRYGPTAQLVVPKWSGTPGQSSSYFDYEEPWTPNLIWDSQEGRTFELGVDRGVFYPKSGDGVPWNGLISVKEKLENAEPTMYYIDGQRYYVDLPVSEYGATIEAFTYPDEFLECSGFMQYAPGLYYDEQPIETFGFSYRTKIGDGLYGPDIFYKIHLVYNAMATPSERSYDTINASPDAATFSWDIVTLPASNSSEALNTAHIVIDSRKVTGSQLKALEDLLYGDGVNPPELPSPDEVQSIFE